MSGTRQTRGGGRPPGAAKAKKPKTGAARRASAGAKRGATAGSAGRPRGRKPVAAKRTAEGKKRAVAGKAGRARGAAREQGLELVPRAARKPVVAKSFPQTAGASGKQMVMFRLIRARARVHAALQGLTAGAAERPLGEGRWNVRQTVLHLCVRDRVRLREFEAALRGVPVSWQGLDDEEMARVNAEDLRPLDHLGWDEALRLLQSSRQQLMDALEAVPEDPAEPWDPGHPFGWMIDALPAHDQHHAEIIKTWRAETGA